MTSLVFVSDVSQVEHLLRRPPEWQAKVLAVTGDLAAAAYLEEHGVAFIDEVDVLTERQLKSNHESAYELASDWWRHLFSQTAEATFALGDATKYDMVRAIEICLNARSIYEQLLATYPERDVYCYSLPRVPTLRSVPAPLFRASASLAQGVLKWCVQQRERRLRMLDAGRPLSKIGRDWVCSIWPPLGVTPSPSFDPQKGFRAVLVPELPGHVVWQTRHPFATGRTAEDRVALFLESLAAPSEVCELEQAFRGQPGWSLVRVSLQETGETFVSPWYQESLVCRLQNLWESFRAARAGYAGPFPEIFANVHLDFQFRHLWKEMERSARYCQSFETLLADLQPSLLVCGFESFTRERVLVRLARRRHIRTATFLHTGLAPLVGFRQVVGDCDHVLVWGENDVRTLVRQGVVAERLRMIGSLSYQEKNRRYRQLAPRPYEGAPQEEARRLLGLPAQSPVVLVLSGSISQGLSTLLARPSAHRKTWRDLLELVRRRKDLSFIHRPHPSYDHFAFYRQLMREAPANFHLLWEADLQAFLQACDVALLVNYCTTGALEACLQKVPVVFLQSAILRSLSGDSPLDEHGAIGVDSIPALEQVIDRLLRDDGFRAQALADGGRLIASVLGEAHERANDHVVHELLRLLAEPSSGPFNQAQKSELCHCARTKQAGLQLGGAANPDQLLEWWRRVLDKQASQETSRTWTRRALVGLAVEIGRITSDVEGIRSLLRESLRMTRGVLRLSRRDQRGMLVGAVLSALDRHVRTGNWSGGLPLVDFAASKLPRALVRSGLSRRLQLSLVREIHSKVESHT